MVAYEHLYEQRSLYMHLKKSTLAVLMIPAAMAHAQDWQAGGVVSGGGRSSFSFFNGGDAGGVGTGVGGQIRIALAERVITEWYYDHLTAPIGDFAHRQDQHIGWSVLFRVLPPRAHRPLLQPYLVAGHCFDHTLQLAKADAANRAERWSSAVQAGAGTHVNLSERFDLSLAGQDMIHLGTDVHADEHDGRVEFHHEQGGSLEGHLLVHLSFNYKLFSLW